MAGVSALSYRQRAWSLSTASLIVMLASCGGEDSGSRSVAVVDGAAPAATPTVQPTPSPSPSPSATPTPTPPPAPTPTPTPAPTRTPELYTIGNLTWSFEHHIAEEVRQPITDVMNWALNQTNTLADYRGNVLVRHNYGTPTAQAGYDWNIQFGGYITWNSALHELAHWLGSGTYWPWGSKVVDGRFTGPITDARIKALDGPHAVLNADWAHFWPYGYNGNDPFHEWQRNVTLVSAQRADMGLSDGAAAIAGDRRFINRSSQLLLDGEMGTGSSPVATALGDGKSLTWRVTFADGYIVLTNAVTGLAIDSLGNAGNGDATVMAARNDSPRQQWEMIPTDQGWFVLRNRQTRLCLDNIGRLAAGTPIAVWSCGRHPNQQWHLVR